MQDPATHKYASRLGLGTVQFGMEYGVSNRRGRPPEETAHNILERAREAGVQVVDTAPSYGDSEKILGRALKHATDFQLITKTPQYANDVIGAHDVVHLRESLHRSLENLGCSEIFGLLLHHSSALFKRGGPALIEGLRELKAEGLVKRIGVSVYDGVEIDRTLALFTPDFIQLPFSIADQRLIRSGHLSKLKELGVEIHARSIFLQGLLLMPPQETPDFFNPMRTRLEKLHRAFAARGMSPLQGCVGFAKACSELDILVIGVNALDEFDETLEAFRDTEAFTDDVELALDDRFVSPRLWPS